MILSSEALEVLAYLKTAPGKFVSLPEISRRAGGRRKFEEHPGWAKDVLPALVDTGVIQVNARGHYRVPPAAKAPATTATKPAAPSPQRQKPKILAGDYFPATPEQPRIVEGDYFPAND